jgi:hypothetical protein
MTIDAEFIFVSVPGGVETVLAILKVAISEGKRRY